ncbi:MAG: glycosyltransferase family 2 protein [Candidatus Buchananbacteria bacterium]|nr:glycosyltransferase family 2 protein [Candidatus Buchananbacteria bacterium]
MEISIIINNYKTKGLLKQCLRGIYAYPPSVDYEIIVVDNNSKDGSVEIVKEQFKQVKLIEARENLGHHKGNNLGIKNSSGRYILILNTDIALLDNSVDKMYQFMESHQAAALVGPKLKNPDGSTQLSCMRFPSKLVPIYRRTFLGNFAFAKKEIDYYLMKDFDHLSTREVDWILGACVLVRKAAIDKVGLMDEDLFLYFGDIAWCNKFWEFNYKVYYFVDADIVHYHKRESAQSGIFSFVFWIHIIDWIRYLKKYSSKPNAKKLQSISPRT